ncbi:MAG: 1-deoxy-D-xylulose-5-phosphate reductoisomerase [Nitrospirae bacterium]|nr:MAG: 1-deoxy-D-xylulose-5-phosphate reductoisomerase [Nitrospirota bacterium]
MKKRVVILGSTGSVGRSALEVVRMFRDRFEVVGLGACRNVKEIAKQAQEFSPEVVCLYEEDAAETLRKTLPGVKVLSGQEGLKQLASHPEADFVLAAISGSAGLVPTFEAVKTGKTIGLANKETLVMAGRIVMETSQQTGAKLIPVDSEHNAIFQCIEGRPPSQIKKLYLTASGGPFRDASMEQMQKATPEEALNHPTWSMGKKITIDSATLMNKGLEVIEAYHLFGVNPERIHVLIHPQSIVHSIVEFIDSGMIAQMSVPDMKGPIAYAMAWPERLQGVMNQCDLTKVGPLLFEEPDLKRFPCLKLAYEALQKGGTATTVLNAANEVAVEAFLEGRISFLTIPVIIEEVLAEHTVTDALSLEDVLEADRWARQKAIEKLEVR